MAFLTPCFVRVEDQAERQKLIKWLKNIGWVFIGPYSKKRKYLLCKPTDKTITAWVMNERYAEALENIGYVFCGTNIDLLRALSAMNDENDREQWFVVLKKVKVRDIEYNDEFWIYDAGKMFFNDVDQHLSKEYFRKSTAEEIVEHFKKREK